MSDATLSHITVLDLTHYIAGPYCTRLLAGMGAEVIKIEKPGGEGGRMMPPYLNDEPHPEKSALFLYLNTNKKGVTLNLKGKAGVGIFKELVKIADVIVESFAPRVMPSLGLDYDNLANINPRVIMTSISNFGQTGPYCDYKAVDIVLEAMSQIMDAIGTYDGEPLTPGFPLAQYFAGTQAAVATSAAIWREVNTWTSRFSRAV